MHRPHTLLAAVLAGLLVASGLAVVSVAVAPAASAQITFTLTGGGYGHGVGLSQFGARGRADAGQLTTDILAAYYPGTSIEGRAVAGPRVKLGDSSSSDMWATGGTITGTPDGGAPVVLANPGERVSVRMFGTAVIYQRVDVAGAPVGVLTTGGGRASITWTPGQHLSVAATGRAYAYGRLRILPTGSAFELVLDSMSMDQYLYGLGEMPASWHSEALRAQAIAGRSFAAYRLSHPQDADFDMFASVQDQAYVGTTQVSSSYGPRWVSAVDTTANQVLTYGGQVIQAFYSSSNGGHTERTDYVFVANLPYYQATPDPLDAAGGTNPNHSWTRTYTGDEIGWWLASAGRGSVGSVTAISVSGNVGASGRVDKATITVQGTTGVINVTGNQFRSAMNAGMPSSRDLISTKFSFSGPPPPPPPPPPVAPADTTAPNLGVLTATPMRFGGSGDICAFVVSDEVAITALHIQLKGVDLRSRVGGVGPDFPQIMCINIPPRLRPSRATNVVLTGAALDASVNLRFVQRTVTIAK